VSHRLVPASTTVRFGSFLLWLAIAAGGCDNGPPSYATGPLPGDSTGLPADSTPTTPPPDTTPQVPPPDTLPDTTATPPDTSSTPPDTVVENPPGTPPTHVGLAFGPAQQAPGQWGPNVDATAYPAQPESLLIWLETARRMNLRLFISFSGSAEYLRNSHGFSLELWKRRVDRFRGMNLQPYIEEGTIAGHLLLDEADDKSNWNGHVVPVEYIDQMAQYSKQIWPTMPTIVRAFPAYLDDYPHPYQYLDAVRIQYHARFGDLDQFIESNVGLARQLGLVVVGGLNVLKGGGPTSGLPNPSDDSKFYMNASQLRSWGKRFLSEPGLCGFLLWQYDPLYFSRQDIEAALKELKQQAATLPNRACRD
jgi:hypothetical protein